jgi:predicted ATP-grasp superfamily ATP-dependent carboligase
MLTRPEQVLEEVLMAARRHGDGVLFPASDLSLVFMSNHREALSERFRFALPARDVVDVCVDKRRQYELAARLGIPHPQSFYPESAADLGEIQRQLRYPGYLKPYHSHLWHRETTFGAKGLVVRDAGELAAAFTRVDAQRVSVVVQSVVQGPASNLLGFRFYLDQLQQLRGRMLSRKLRQDNPDFGSGSLVESIEDSDNPIEAHSMRFLRELKYWGVGTTEFKRDDRDGQVYLIELNGRFWSSNWHAYQCGVNFPLLLYRDVTGQAQAPQLTYRAGVRFVNFRGDRESFRKSRQRGEITWRQWLASLTRVRAFAFFDVRDLPAFLGAIGPQRGWRQAVRNLARRIAVRTRITVVICSPASVTLAITA